MAYKCNLMRIFLNRVAGFIQAQLEKRLFKKVGIVLIITVIVIVLADIVFTLMGDSISEQMKKWSVGSFFVLTWVWGVLTGHLFLPIMKEKRLIPELWAIGILVLIAFVMTMFGMSGYPITSLKGHIILLIFGVCVGSILWPQNLPTSYPL